MFRRKEIITAIEIATSKVRVLVGEADEESRGSVLGYCERDTSGGVIKGEITDLDKVLPALREAVDEADSASGFELDRNRVFLAISGSGIGSTQGVGSVIPAARDGRITVGDLEEAQKNALNKPIGYDRMILNTFEAGCLVDGRPVRNPLGQVGEKLEVLVHIIHGRSIRIENFINALRDFGFSSEHIRPVFSGAAAVFGVLTQEEREHGGLMIDVGAGTTEAVVVRQDGMQASCVVPVGFDHIANDLAIGLDLHIVNSRKLLTDGSLLEARDANLSFIEVKERLNAPPRRIPLNSIEKIISLRLQELISIIQKKIEHENRGLLGSLSGGCILTGGGALYPGTAEVFKRCLGMPVRCGYPINAGVAVSELNSPRCGVIWGAFKYGLEVHNTLDSVDERNPLERGIEAVDSLFLKKAQALRRALKM